MSQTIFDVAVIGGGVAGCAAAIHLARQGQRVILCEAKSYPHHKVCGEFLSPECAILLDELGLTGAIQAVKPAALHTVAIIAPNGTRWETDLPGTAIGISRYALDHLMAIQARTCGVEVHEKMTVTALHGSLDTGFFLNTRTSAGKDTLHARTVIGAHGKSSRVDRALNRSFLNQPQPFVGLKAHFYGPPLPGRIHLHTFPGGYCGMSGVENGLINVCLLVREETFRRTSSAGVHDFVEWMKSQNPTLDAWFSAAEPAYPDWLSIARVSFAAKESLLNDVLMVGDAAGLIAPIAGDGMGMALQASQIAASLLYRYLTGSISTAALRRHYQTEWRQTFGGRLYLSRWLQAFLLRPNAVQAGLRLLNAAPALGHFFVSHTRDHRLMSA